MTDYRKPEWAYRNPDIVCDVCGKREGENHDLPGRCRPEIAKITVVELDALRRERDKYRACLEDVRTHCIHSEDGRGWQAIEDRIRKALDDNV